MKLVLCASAYPPDIRGGGEISTALIAKGLTDIGIDVTVVTFTDGKAKRESQDGVDVLRLNCPNVYWSMRSDQASRIEKTRWHLSQAFRPRPPRGVTDAIADLSPDLIHTSTIEDFGASFWRWAAASGIKTAHSLRSYCLLHRGATLYDPQADATMSADFMSRPKRFYAGSLDGVIGISNAILQTHLQEGFFRGAMTRVIHNPCDAPIAESNFKAGPVRLGVLGRISPEKGITQLIARLRDVETTNAWTLDVAGDGTKTAVDSLRAQSAGLPIRFRGWCESRPFLSELDLLIVPSRWEEPFGRIVVEAFSIGLPVVCLRRGGLPELVTEAKTGWILSDWDAASLSSVIESCRSLDRNAIRDEAKAFTVERIAAQHVAFYEDLLCERANTPLRNSA